MSLRNLSAIVATTLFLASCGSAEGKDTKAPGVPEEVSQAAPAFYVSDIREIIDLPDGGRLPDDPSFGLGELQIRTQALLLEGVEEGQFPPDGVAPDQAFFYNMNAMFPKTEDSFPLPDSFKPSFLDFWMSKSSGRDPFWSMRNDRRVLYLVHRNLEEVSEVWRSRYFAETCPNGQLYSGFAAALPFLYYRAIWRAGGEDNIETTPYGILVCETSRELSVTLIRSDHISLGEKRLPHYAPPFKK